MKSDIKNVRTRFAPSPTGDLHVGGLRTALYSYALAKHNNGFFVLRIEDTDKKREVEGSEDRIKEILHNLGLIWDKLYKQSERVAEGIYKKAAEKMVADGHAFYCECEAKNAKVEGFSTNLRDPCRDKGLSSGAIKLKVPDNELISFTDFVLEKQIEWHSPVVFDATLLKSDGYPTYHLAVVVDDHDMNITHVLRGHDWMPSTPIHLFVYKYLGYQVPEIGHLTDILDPAGGKLSKRKGSVTLDRMIEEGYLQEAILNFVMLLGWAPKDNREIYSLNDFVEDFSKDGLQSSNPVFNRDKLDWFNGEYVRKMTDDTLAKRINQFYNDSYDAGLINKITPLIKERITKLSDFKLIAGFFFERPKSIDKDMFGENVGEHLGSAVEVLSKVEKWNLENINNVLMEEIGKKGYKTGKFFMDLRVAITGNKQTPPINESIEILGKEETLARLNNVLTNN